MLRIHRENYKASNELTISEILKAVLLLGLEGLDFRFQVLSVEI